MTQIKTLEFQVLGLETTPLLQKNCNTWRGSRVVEDVAITQEAD